MLKKFFLMLMIGVVWVIIAYTTVCAATFTTNDLTGTWYGHQVVSGDAPGDDPRWGYGISVIDGSSNYTATWSSPTQTNEVTTGTIQIDGSGIVGLNNDPLIHGVMNDDKDQIVLIDGSSSSQGNALIVFVKRHEKALPHIPLLLLGN